MAANLAEAGYRVLLLEAGGETENANYSFRHFTRCPQKIKTYNGTIMSGITPTRIVKTTIPSETNKAEEFGIRGPARLEAARLIMP